MSGYKKPCRYCGELVEPDSDFCPVCGKEDPSGPARCPDCRAPVQESWKLCNKCGRSLIVKCPKCGKDTFLAMYCRNCNEKLVIVCPDPKCNTEQPVGNDKCIKCGKALGGGKKNGK